MTRTLVRDTAGSSDPEIDARESAGAPNDGHNQLADTPSPKSRIRSRSLRAPIVLQLTAMIGIGALLYPSAADWFSTRNHNSEVSGYVQAVEQLPTAARLQKLQVAKDYNAHIPAGTLRDPYGADGDAELNEDLAYQAYTQVLQVSDSGVIGEMSYPRLGIGLPIYHGTGESAISRGVGHLYGSSLPVGGPSTHAVLTSHSGLVKASLFTRLPQAAVGDTFQVTVLGETHHYAVESIETIEPFITDSLAIVPGEDRVTLITCTPIGVNSHRLLVHGVRIASPVSDGTHTLAGDGRTAGFPWWALLFLGGSAATAYLLFVPPKHRERKRGSASPQNNMKTQNLAHSQEVKP